MFSAIAECQSRRKHSVPESFAANYEPTTEPAAGSRNAVSATAASSNAQPNPAESNAIDAEHDGPAWRCQSTTRTGKKC